MGLDVKLPIGLLFTVFGLLLVFYGAVSDPAIYAKSLGMNVNLIWGCLMLAFGLGMLLLSRRSLRAADEPARKAERAESGRAEPGLTDRVSH